MDTPKECFIKQWGTGYVQSWGYALPFADFENAALKPFFNKEHVAIEIGCGRGIWTKEHLSPNFKKVICLDVIPRSDWLASLPNVEYVELPDRNFSCYGVEDDSIDFAWSFGCFCHLSMDAVREYLKSLYKKMKIGANAALMFGNWPRHPEHKSLPKDASWSPEQCPWFYQDLDLVGRAIADAGFVEFRDLLPTFRETMAYFKK